MSSEQHSQPREGDVYNSTENPVDKKPSEIHSSRPATGENVEHRVPHDEDKSTADANPTPLARGIRGKESTGSTVTPDTNPDVDDNKPDAPASESRVHDAVTSNSKPGSGGQEPSFTANLDV